MNYNGIEVNWTPREEEKIAEIKARKKRPRRLTYEDTKYDRNIRSLWHYYDWFFHPEIGFKDNKWEVVHDNP